MLGISWLASPHSQTADFTSAVASNVHLALTYMQVSPVGQMPLYANIWLKLDAPGGYGV